MNIHDEDDYGHYNYMQRDSDYSDYDQQYFAPSQDGERSVSTDSEEGYTNSHADSTSQNSLVDFFEEDQMQL